MQGGKGVNGGRRGRQREAGWGTGFRRRLNEARLITNACVM